MIEQEYDWRPRDHLVFNSMWLTYINLGFRNALNIDL